MIGWIKKIRKGLSIVNRIQAMVDEGQDVYEEVRKIQAKYGDLPDDVKLSWIQVKQFVDSVRDIFNPPSEPK